MNTETEERCNASAEERAKLAILITNLFDLWRIDKTVQLNLLGLSKSSRALLSKYRNGKPLPDSRDILDRIGWLLSVHKTLQLLYPTNKDLRATWVSRRNEVFEGKRPVEVMTDEGIIGIARVSRYLDFQIGR